MDEESSNKSDNTGNKQDHLFSRKGNGFSRGLGISLGKNFAFIRKALEFRIFAKAAINIQFAIGLGEGLGYVFPYISDELQDRILQKSKEPSLARGLGIGLGHVLYYLHVNEELKCKIYDMIDKNKIFAKSLNASLNYNFLSLNDHKLIKKTSSTRGRKFDYNEIEFSFNDYPTEGLPNNKYYYCTYKENEAMEQNVIDDEIKEYLQMVMDEIKTIKANTTNKSNTDRMNKL